MRAGPLSGKRILVVEDEFMIAQEMAGDLAVHGAEVVGPVPTIGQAKELVERGPAVDGAILDINLNGEMVYPLADWLLARATPIVFASGYDATAIPATFKHVPLLGKPLDIHAVVEVLTGRTNPT